MAVRARLHSLTLLDQIVSSASNLIVPFVAARRLQPNEFGLFAVAFSAALLVLGISRSYWGSRVSLSRDPRQASSEAASAILLLYPVLFGIVFLISVVTAHGQISGNLVAAAAVAPFVCIQDVLRFGAVSLQRAEVALLGDVVWLVTLLLLLGLLGGAGGVIWLWGAGALASALVMSWRMRVRPGRHLGVKAILSVDSASLSLATRGVIATATTLVLLYVAGRVCGPGCVGSLQGSWTLMSPTALLGALMGIGLTPLLRGIPLQRMFALCAGVGAVGLTITAAWVALLVLSDDRLGPLLLGATWEGARPLLPYAAVTAGAGVFGAAAGVGLRAAARARALLVTQILATVVVLVAGFLALRVWDSLPAVAAAEALAAVVGALAAWVSLFFVARQGPGQTPGIKAAD